MNSGDFRHFVEVFEETESEEKNALGENQLKETKIGDFFAEFKNKTGNMLYGRSADSKLANTTHKITYRYDNFPNLSEKHFLKIKGETFSIEYIDNLDNKNELMEVFLSRDNLR